MIQGLAVQCVATKHEFKNTYCKLTFVLFARMAAVNKYPFNGFFYSLEY